MKFVRYNAEGVECVGIVIAETPGEMHIWATYIDDLEICVMSAEDWRITSEVVVITYAEYISRLQDMAGRIYG